MTSSPRDTHWEADPAETAAIGEAFAVLDSDGDGSVTPQDLIGACGKLNIPVARGDVYGVVAAHDVDGEGRLDYAEFRRAMVENVNPDDVSSEYDALWSGLDPEDAGFVDAERLATLFAEFGEDAARVDVSKMLAGAKGERPDRVTKKELQKLLAYASKYVRNV